MRQDVYIEIDYIVCCSSYLLVYTGISYLYSYSISTTRNNLTVFYIDFGDETNDQINITGIFLFFLTLKTLRLFYKQNLNSQVTPIIQFIQRCTE